MISKILTNEVLTVVVNGKTFTILREHPRFEVVIEALKTNDADHIEDVLDTINRTREYLSEIDGDVEIYDGSVYYNGERLDNGLTTRIVEMMELGLDVDHMVVFLRNLMENPSFQSRKELYEWMEACDLPITEDGRFIAYKVVGEDYLDKYSRSIDNSVGQVVEMDRGRVDDNRRNECSYGLHFCSRYYIEFFRSEGDRLMVVAINPKDVVSIPEDYNRAKGRCSRYEVIDEIEEARSFNQTPVYGG